MSLSRWHQLSGIASAKESNAFHKWGGISSSLNESLFDYIMNGNLHRPNNLYFTVNDFSATSPIISQHRMLFSERMINRTSTKSKFNNQDPLLHH